MRRIANILVAIVAIGIVSCVGPAGAAAAEPGPPPGIPSPPPTSVPTKRVEDPTRPSAWERALDEANGAHLEDIVEPRPIAAAVGLAWFALALRARVRRRRGARTSVRR